MSAQRTFFFQAEDGIRDGHVTGVQTCALPIYAAGRGDRVLGEVRRRADRRPAPGVRRRAGAPAHGAGSDPGRVMRPPAEPSTRARTGPYVGLDFFGEADADVFFGRDDERKMIIGNLRASRLTLLYAESGVGKSSLLRAGVAARLRRQAERHAG